LTEQVTPLPNLRVLGGSAARRLGVEKNQCAGRITVRCIVPVRSQHRPRILEKALEIARLKPEIAPMPVDTAAAPDGEV
jgi:hypothetical protein